MKEFTKLTILRDGRTVCVNVFNNVFAESYAAKITKNFPGISIKLEKVYKNKL